MKNTKPVFVTKSFLPPLRKYEKYLRKIWNTHQLTNQGTLLKEFETKLEKFLNVKRVHFLTNGMLSLQLALRALDITEGEIITTPFSYVATTSAILWERCQPVYVDIEPNTFCIDVDKIEKAITSKTKAILAVHVFGFPCDVEKIASIAKKHKLKVIYDGAHAFGARHNGNSLLSYGDISMGSFHATKLFHTIEGGCLIVKDKSVSDKIELLKRFGHNGDNHLMLGVNAKASEFQAAMGLCNLEYIDKIIKKRSDVTKLYNNFLGKRTRFMKGFEYNYSYYPIVLEDEKQLQKKLKALKNENITARRYFYPSLNTLPYLDKKYKCPISEEISKRILCLPLYHDLDKRTIKKICSVLEK